MRTCSNAVFNVLKTSQGRELVHFFLPMGQGLTIMAITAYKDIRLTYLFNYVLSCTNKNILCQQKLLIPRKTEGSPIKPAVVVTPSSNAEGSRLPLLKPRGGLSPVASPVVRSTNKPLSHPLLGRGRGRGGYRGRGRGNTTLTQDKSAKYCCFALKVDKKKCLTIYLNLKSTSYLMALSGSILQPKGFIQDNCNYSNSNRPDRFKGKKWK